MTPQEALNLVAQVCNAYRGTLQEHQQLQAALAALSEAVEPKVPEARKMTKGA